MLPSLPPERRTPAIVLGVAVLVLGLSCWGIYSSDGARKARERDDRLALARASGGVDAGPSLRVAAIEVRRESAAEIVAMAGVLEPVRATWVAAEIAGRIVEVPAAEHAPIAAGDVLVRLDASLPSAELIRARAAHEFAKAELARQQRLGKSSVASEAELDRAISEERSSYAALMEAQTRLSHTEIRAPFDGVVNARELDPGAYVQPGTLIAEVLDISTLEISVHVSDRQRGAIERDAAVAVRIDPLNRVVEGRVARTGRAPETGTQRYPVVIALENPNGALLPGMLAHVELEVGSLPSLRLPAGAVLREFELDYVYALENGAVPGQALARRRRVTTRPVPFRPDQVEVLDGLEDGVWVAVSSLAQLRDGTPVRVERVEPLR